MGLVEHDDAVEGVAVVLVEGAGKPFDDLVQARAFALAGRRAERGVGREEDALGERDLRALAELAERNHVGLPAAERGPVAACVLDELVGLGQPERPALAAQPAVQDHRGNLAALARAGAVAQHPALAELHGRGKGFAVLGSDGGMGCRIPVVVAALDGFPAGADAERCSEMAGVGLARKDDALELGVGQQAVGHRASGQHRTVGGRGVGHRGHGARLHQRGWVSSRTRNCDGVRTPGFVAPGGRCGGVCVRQWRFDAIGQLADLSRVARSACGRRAAARACGPGGGLAGCGHPAGRGDGGCRLDRRSGRQGCDDGIQERGDGGCCGLAVELDARAVASLQNGEPGLERGPASREDMPVDGHREDDARSGIERLEGIAPGVVAGHAVRGGDGRKASADGEHRDGGTDVAQVRVVAAALDAGRRRERRIHQDRGGPDARQKIGDALGVVARDRGLRKEPLQDVGAIVRDLVEVQCAGGAASHGALRHHRENAGAGAGFQHDIARADVGGTQRDIGKRNRGGELLQAHLRFGPPGVRGLQRLKRRQHGEHVAGTGGADVGATAHGAAVTLQEQHNRRFGGFVGVLPQPGAVGVGRAARVGHGAAERRGVEEPSGFQRRQQGVGGVEKRRGVAAGRRGGVGEMLACGSLRRRCGVEHDVTPIVRDCRDGMRGMSSRTASPNLFRAPGLRLAGARSGYAADQAVSAIRARRRLSAASSAGPHSTICPAAYAASA